MSTGKSFIVTGLFLLGSLMASAQGKQSVFSAPFDFPLYLSGNFGELRANHFHGGLDFKTEGKAGRKMLALADGYIAKARVTNGSGYVLEVQYDNGYYTINRHLSDFMPALSKRIADLQYAKKRYEVEIKLKPGECPVKRGEQIGWSGNTGYSYGPHLHLDLIESATGQYVDPMPMFRKYLKDTMAPKAFGFQIFPQLGKGVVNGKTEEVRLPVGEQKYPEVWGEVGVGIRAYDYMDGTTNKYGVKHVSLYVDGELVFRSVVDRFFYYENPYINSWATDDYMKSFIEPGNRLRMLTAYNKNRGLLTIDEERVYHLEYVLEDDRGNVSKYRLCLKGKQQEIPAVDKRDRHFWSRTRTNVLMEPGMNLVVPKGMLYDDHLLHSKVFVDSSAVSNTYQLHDQTLRLHQAQAKLSIGLIHRPVADMKKYVIARVLPSGKLSAVASKYENGFVHANIRQLGTYRVAVDTVAPVVTAQRPESWAVSRRISFSVKDNLAGISWVSGTVDGKFVVLGRENMTNSAYVCRLDEKRIPKTGKKRKVRIVAVDVCGNKTVRTASFVW